MPSEVYFEVPLLPRGKGAPRAFVVGGHARVSTDKRTGHAMGQFIALAMPNAPPAPFSGPVAVELELRFPIPTGWPRWRRFAAERRHAWHAVKPDADNCQKLILDALTQTGRFWRDDAQVASIQASKCYGPTPSTRVRIRAMDEWDRPTAEAWMRADANEDRVPLEGR